MKVALYIVGRAHPEDRLDFFDAPEKARAHAIKKSKRWPSVITIFEVWMGMPASAGYLAGLLNKAQGDEFQMDTKTKVLARFLRGVEVAR